MQVIATVTTIPTQNRQLSEDSNSARVERQKKAPLRMIIGNLHSIGLKSANDNAANQKYEKLDDDIAKTYAKLSTAGLNKSFAWSTE